MINGNSMFIQPQPVNARDANRGFIAKFDNLQEAMGYLKAVDTIEQAAQLDPLVQLASFGPLDNSREGAVLGDVSSRALARMGYDSAAMTVPASGGIDWTVQGPAGIVSFTEGPNGTAAVVADRSGLRSVAISPASNGILYEEVRPH